MNKKIKEALQEVEPKVFYGIGRFQNRNNWDCIVYGRRRKGKTESRAGVIIRYFVAIVKEEEIPEGMEEKVVVEFINDMKQERKSDKFYIHFHDYSTYRDRC